MTASFGSFNITYSRNFTNEASTDLALQNIFDRSAGNHHRFIFDIDPELVSRNGISTADRSKYIDAETPAAGITTEGPALFLYCGFCFLTNLVGRSGKSDTEIAFGHKRVLK